MAHDHEGKKRAINNGSHEDNFCSGDAARDVDFDVNAMHEAFIAKDCRDVVVMSDVRGHEKLRC